MTAIVGPHQKISAADPRERFALELFDTLWSRYRQRVEYVQTYERVIAEAGATFVNDHIAFRTFAGQRPLTGIASISRIFEALGYQAANCYHFDDKHLAAIHFQHANQQFPKLFLSELQTWKLSPAARATIERTVGTHRPPVAAEVLVDLAELKSGDLEPGRRARLLETLVREFHELPWQLPEKNDLTALNQESQYAAWVLVHGYSVNHFTSLINSHGVMELQNIDRVVEVLRRAGIPMKTEIEGAPGTRLRQTATEAVTIDVPIRDNARETTMPWTYAYFELAERGELPDPETGQMARFEGFLGPQATQLFEMTKVKG